MKKTSFFYLRTMAVAMIFLTANFLIARQMALSEKEKPEREIRVMKGKDLQRNKVIVEFGTGTWCTYDPGALMGAEDLIANGCEVAVIMNHNGDPFANAYSNARNTYYNITAFPNAIFDGVLSVVGGNHSTSMYPQYLPNYQARYSVPSPVDISITGTGSGDNYNVTLTIRKLAAITSQDLKVLLVLTESNIAYNWQGMDHLNYVTRLMAPDATGTTLDFSSGDIQVIDLSFVKDHTWVNNNCEVIAFVQDNISREIFNGIKVPLNSFTPTNLFPPQNLQASVEETTVHLTWEAPVQKAVLTGYNIYRNYTLVHTSSASDLFYDDTDLSPGIYSYMVTALYDEGESNPTAPVQVTVQSGGPVIYATNFESFTAGEKVACQDPINWTTWMNAPCGGEDALVSADFAHSGVNSVKITDYNDPVLPMGDKTTGKFQFDIWMYIPTGHGGLYDILHDFTPSSSEWGLVYYFTQAGSADLQAGGQIISVTYPHDQWFRMTHIIDLDNDMAEVLLDNVHVFSWQWSMEASSGRPGIKKLAAIDFYSGMGVPGIVDPLYYFDDIEYKKIFTPPQIVVTPSSFNECLEPNTLATQTMNIANAGGFSLDFSMDVSCTATVKSVKIINQQPQYERIMEMGWLSVIPLTGSVPADGSTDVQITFDATGLPVGTYDGLLTISSNDPAHPVKEVPVSLQVKIPGTLPFVEDWNSGSFGANIWTFDPNQSNWSINTGYGNPAPSAQFKWTPAITNYSFALVTPIMKATEITDNVTLKFDLELDNSSISTLEGMAVEVFDGTAWQLVHDYTNVDGSFLFTSATYNITALAAGKNFNVRFRAYGQDSYNLKYWYVDNIRIYRQIVGNLTGSVTKLSDGSLIEGALVTITNSASGAYSATTDANGIYNIIDVEAGDYAIGIQKTGFNKIEGNATIIGNETVTSNFQMTAPNIGVDPASLSVTVPCGETTTRTVTLFNTGNGPVNWMGSIQTIVPDILYSIDYENFTVGSQVACQDSFDWATIDPLSDAIAPGGSQIVTVTFNGAYAPPQKDLTVQGVLLIETDPNAGSPEVALSMTIQGSFFGVLTGFVNQEGVAIPGVTVTATRQESPSYTYTMVTGADGMYSFPTTLYGTYDLTAEKPCWNSFVSTVPAVVTGDQTTIYNIEMDAPIMVITPLEVVENVTIGALVTKTIIISNTGDEPLNWEGQAVLFNKQVPVPASDGKFPRGTAAPSIGRAPVGASMPSKPLTGKGTPGYAYDIYPGMNFFSFNTDAPATQHVISSISYQPFGGTFDAVNTDFMYVIDYNTNTLLKVEIATGAVTPIGASTSFGDEAWTGITVDKSSNIMYGISTNITESHIYTIDMETGAATVIGPTGIPGAIDCAIDGTGQMYAFDIVNDQAFKVDKETGISTLLGSIGYDANYAQGMGWDPETDVVYIAALNLAPFQGELRILDRVTGNTALIGDMGGEIDALAFPGDGTPPWLSIAPKTGILPAGSSEELTVTLDAAHLDFGTYAGTINVTTNPDVCTVNVPVTLDVGAIGGPAFIIKNVYYAVSGPVTVPVHATEITNMGSFRFTLDYDVTRLTYTGTSNWYPGITDVLVGTPSPGKLTFVWAASGTGTDIPDGNFFNVDFTFDGSMEAANIAWSDNPAPREFRDYPGNIFVPVCENGLVTGNVNPTIPDILTIPTTEVVNGESPCFNANQTIVVAGNGKVFNVNEGASVTMIAGQNIVFLPSVQVEEGGYLHGYITTNNEYCSPAMQPSAMIQNKQAAETPLIPHGKGYDGDDCLVKVYPNPTSGMLNIVVQTIETNKPIRIRISNLLGEVVYSKELTGMNTDEITLVNIKPGMYLLHVIQGNNIEGVKVIKN